MKFSFATLYEHRQNFTSQRFLLTEDNITSLSPATCRVLTSHDWFSSYGFDDIWNRQATWKLPLVQLLFLFTRQPFGWKANCFTIIHLIGDPINTLGSLLFAIEHCQIRASLIRGHCVRVQNRRPVLSHRRNQAAQQKLKQRLQDDFTFEWKAFTLLLISYDELGVPEGEIFLTAALNSMAKMENHHAQRFRHHFYHAASSLAADRSTLFLPMLVAQAIFLGSFLVALVKARGVVPQEHNWINVEAHAIAMSMALAFLCPAVFFSKVLGASQTESKIPRVLNSLRDNLEREKAELQTETGKDMLAVTFPRKISLCQSWTKEHSSQDDYSTDQQEALALHERIDAGGLYCFQPALYGKRNRSTVTSRSNPSFQIAKTMSFFLFSGLVANVISWRVPPEGFDCRNLGETGVMLWWILSFGLGSLCSRKRTRFALMFWKDIFFMTTTITFLVLVQVGIHNRCECYDLWGQTPLMLPQIPEVAAILMHRMKNEWLIWTIVGILGEIIMCFAVCWHYRLAVRVLLQRDDGISNLHDWPEWLKCIIRWREYNPSHQKTPPELDELLDGDDDGEIMQLRPIQSSSTSNIEIP